MRQTIFILFLFMSSGLFAQLQISPEQLLGEYVKVKSVTGNEKPGAVFLMNKCKEAGLYITVFNDEQNSFNFAASLYPLESRKPNVVFHTHCDVVHEGDSIKWKYPPYSGTIADSMVWGRGSIDNKALAVMQLLALQNFTDTARQQDLPYNFTILGVSGEETGGTMGAARIVENNLQELNPVVIFGEGGTGAKNVLRSSPERTIYGISIACKQGVWLDLSLHNEQFAHGAAATEANVNRQMVKALHKIGKQKTKLKFNEASMLMLKELSDYEKGLVRFVYRHPNLCFPLIRKKILNDQLLKLIFTDSYNITNINSPYSSVNSIANEVHAIIDCRLLGGVSPDEVINYVTKTIKCPSASIKLIGKSPELCYTEPDKFYSILKQAIEASDPGVAVVPMLFPAITDNAHFRSKGIPTYGLLPCVLTQKDVNGIHNINERMPVKGLYQGISVYTNLIRFLLQEN